LSYSYLFSVLATQHNRKGVMLYNYISHFAGTLCSRQFCRLCRRLNLAFETLQPARHVGRTCCLYFDPITTQPQSLTNFEQQSISTCPPVNFYVVVEICIVRLLGIPFSGTVAERVFVIFCFNWPTDLLRISWKLRLKNFLSILNSVLFC
jgi:hypothetical protein